MILTPTPIKMAPFFIHYNKLKNKNLKPLSTYHKACLSYVIPHGITDLFVYPGEISLFNYSYTFLFYNMYPNSIKYLLLMLFSVYLLPNTIHDSLFLIVDVVIPLRIMYTSSLVSNKILFLNVSIDTV